MTEDRDDQMKDWQKAEIAALDEEVRRLKEETREQQQRALIDPRPKRGRFWIVMLTVGWIPLLVAVQLGTHVIGQNFTNFTELYFAILIVSVILWLGLLWIVTPKVDNLALFKSLEVPDRTLRGWSHVSAGGALAAARELLRYTLTCAIAVPTFLIPLQINEKFNATLETGVFKPIGFVTTKSRSRTINFDQYENGKTGEQITTPNDHSILMVPVAKACLEADILRGGLGLDRIVRYEPVDCTPPLHALVAKERSKGGRTKPTNFGQAGTLKIVQFATNSYDQLSKDWREAGSAAGINTTSRFAVGETLYAGFLFRDCDVDIERICDLSAEFELVVDPAAGEDGLVRSKIDHCCKIEPPILDEVGLSSELYRQPIVADLEPGDYELRLKVTDNFSKQVIKTRQVITVVSAGDRAAQEAPTK
jgi:hypothetical protein